MLPIAMAVGAGFYKWIGELTFISPYLIFVMLTVTYCRLKPSDFKVTRFQTVLCGVQLILSAAAFFLFLPFGLDLASGVFICFFIPTATAAPVITGMLGGSVSKLATYTLVSNMVTAVVGPLALAAMGCHTDMTFFESFRLICSHVLPLLVLPLVTAMTLRYAWPRACTYIAGHQGLSFYLWAVALLIVVGSSTGFVVRTFDADNLWLMLSLAFGALAACGVQFAVGRKIGRRYGDVVSGGQGLGQKNTVLGIWLALAYLHPIASIAPAAYVAWQNIVNSWQLYRHRNPRR